MVILEGVGLVAAHRRLDQLEVSPEEIADAKRLVPTVHWLQMRMDAIARELVVLGEEREPARLDRAELRALRQKVDEFLKYRSHADEIYRRLAADVMKAPWDGPPTTPDQQDRPSEKE